MIRRIILPAALITALLMSACGSQGPPEAGPSAPGHYVGVAGLSPGQLSQFEDSTGVRPQLVEIYMSFGFALSNTGAAGIVAQKDVPVIQLNPYHISLSSIAAGYYDGYLSRLGTALKALGHQVILSFAPEANGTWYSWACHHVAASVYVAAWRHVHNVIARYDSHITWMWDVNATYPAACPLTDRWPGVGYVDWVGVDGYLRDPGDSFDTILAPTITAVRAATGKPVLIAETGVPDVPEAASWLESIFTGAEDIPGVLGIVYFDYKSANGDYRLQRDPKALAAFREAARAYQSSK
jgi:mannan endo-1,4-beta-mannosidase